MTKPFEIEPEPLWSINSKNEGIQHAITLAIQDARQDGEEVVIAVCVSCPRDNKHVGSCFMCDKITVDPTGKVIFEGIH